MFYYTKPKHCLSIAPRRLPVKKKSEKSIIIRGSIMPPLTRTGWDGILIQELGAKKGL
jgi:hypothetical protein